MKTRKFFVTLQWGDSSNIRIGTFQFELIGALKMQIIKQVAERAGAPKDGYVILFLHELEE